jgi:hypothetical protein
MLPSLYILPSLSVLSSLSVLPFLCMLPLYTFLVCVLLKEGGERGKEREKE